MNQRSISFFCAACSLYNLYELPIKESLVKCRYCNHKHTMHLSKEVINGTPIDQCPLCKNLAMYHRKDFPQQLGCAAITLTVVLSSVAYALWDFPAAILVLASIADFLLFHRLREVTVCYKCHSELRGFLKNDKHGPFDMHVAEEYDHGT